MPTVTKTIAENLQRVRERIAAACSRSEREADQVRLVAVTKYAELDWIRELVELGVVDLGESRPQQLVQRAGLLPGEIRWHLIGHLQRNKVAHVLPHATLIHSVDSLRLLERIATVSSPDGRPGLLLEVNVSGESAKDGFAPSGLVDSWEAVVETALPIAGLMTMAPLTDDPETARDVFRQLRALRDRLAVRGPFALNELSMGMSNDFDLAIEEGATIIRVGGDLFRGLS